MKDQYIINITRKIGYKKSDQKASSNYSKENIFYFKEWKYDYSYFII